MRKLTATQRKLLTRMKDGHTLWWFGGHGPELYGFPLWPTKRTVRALLRAGLLRWKEPQNKTQTECGIYELEVSDGVSCPLQNH